MHATPWCCQYPYYTQNRHSCDSMHISQLLTTQHPVGMRNQFDSQSGRHHSNSTGPALHWQITLTRPLTGIWHPPRSVHVCRWRTYTQCASLHLHPSAAPLRPSLEALARALRTALPPPRPSAQPSAAPAAPHHRCCCHADTPGAADLACTSALPAPSSAPSCQSRTA